MSIYPRSAIWGAEGDQFANHATKKYRYGQIMVFEDGRAFRYVKAGATALVPGKLYQNPVTDANYDELVTAAAALAATTITVTLGATALTLNQLAEGFINVEDDAGEGQIYKIKSHPAAAASATCVLTLESPNGVKTALTSASTCGLLDPLYKDIIITVAPPSASVAGVAVEAVTAAQWGWVQVQGVASVLTDGTVVIGNIVVPSVNTAGAVMARLLVEGTPNTGAQTPQIGDVVAVAVTTEYSIINLTIL